MRISLDKRLTAGILEALKQRQTSVKAVSKLYRVSEGYLSRTLKRLHLQRIPAPTMAHKRNSKILKASRTQHRVELARKTLQGKPIPEAAKEANCSPRTIYRYLELVKND